LFISTAAAAKFPSPGVKSMTAPAFKKSNIFAKKSLEKKGQPSEWHEAVRHQNCRRCVVVQVVVVNRPANWT